MKKVYSDIDLKEVDLKECRLEVAGLGAALAAGGRLGDRYARSAGKLQLVTGQVTF